MIDHYKVQQEGLEAFHIASMHVNAQRGATFSSHSFSLGGKFVRNDAIAILDGEGAEVTLNGLYLADGDRLVDNHTEIDHAKAHCPSHEVYKGILGGKARAIFNGKIIVRPDAQKTNAKQTNRALLLSDDASINTKPQLEIFADDVKCTHGAAIGQLDEDAIFYLRARGLTYFEARDMLIHAFAGEILDQVKVEPLQARARGGALRPAREGPCGARRGMTARTHDQTGTRRVAGADVLDVDRVRADFPILQPHGARAAAGLPRQRRDDAEAAGGARCADAVLHRHQFERAPRRAQSQRAGHRRLRAARAARCAAFFNASSDREIVFTRNATEGINLVAQSFVRPKLQPGDEVLISALEHHSNIVPWQLICEERGARLKVVPMDDRGELLLDAARDAAHRAHDGSWRSRTCRTRSARSTRSTGSCAWRTRKGVPVLADGSQAAYHMPVDVQALGVDFYVATGHKLYGPTGIGVLYGRESAARGDAAVPRRRRHDRVGDVREVDLERAALQVRGGHAAHRRGDRSRRGARLHFRSIGFEAIGRHEQRPPRLRDACRSGASTACGSSARRRTRRASCPSSWTGSTRTTSARSSTAREWRSAPDTTARSRSWSASASRRRPVRRSRCTTRATRSTCWPRRSRRSRRCSADVGPQRSLPGSYPRPQQAAEELPHDRGGEPPRRRLQPAVRRQAEPDRAGRRRQRSRTSRSSGPAARSPRRPRR